MSGKSFLTIAIFLLAFLLRLIFITSAHHGDLNNNISWGQIAVSSGLNGFYGSSNSDDWPYSAPNQPPLTILMFAGTSVVWRVIKDFIWYLNWEHLIFPSSLVWFWDEKGMDIMVKLPSVFADLGIGWIIYRYLQKNGNMKKALVFTSVWLFNPVVWYNSVIWGQTDSVVNLLGLIGVFALLEKNLVKFGVFYTLSILFKGSLSVFAPVLIFVILKLKFPFSEWIKTVFYSLTGVILVTLWFHPYFDLPFWLIDLYRERILPGEIGFLTANAFNFWWLVDSGNTYDSVLYYGIPARIWGFALTLMLIYGIIYFYLRSKLTNYKVFASLAISAFTAFLFMTRIHERYLYPFFPYATLASFYLPSFLPYLILISILHLFNLYNLFWIPTLPYLQRMMETGVILNYLSLANLVMFALMLRHFKTAKL